MANSGLPEYYKEVFEKKVAEAGIYKFYESYNMKKEKKVCIKVLNKENNEDKNIDINFFLNQIKKESNILQQLNSDYIIKFSDIIDNDKYYILETEYVDCSIKAHLSEETVFDESESNINKNENINIFKDIVITLVQALKELKEKGIIHRNIKPENIFVIPSIEEPKKKFEIKLSNFDCAIYIKDVPSSKPMGTFIYTAPEIINNLEYDEKADYWSLGVVLFELYFGCPPFRKDESIYNIRKILDGKEDFIFRKSGIPTLDVLFKRLLCINPNERMLLEELCDFVENENFLKQDIIYDNDKYKIKYTQLYEDIKKEKQIDYPKLQKEAFGSDVKTMITEILSFFKTVNHSGIIQYNDIKFEQNIKFNNIIYYDEIIDKKHQNEVYSDCEIFEENTQGAFIFCGTMKELELIKAEILEEFRKNNKYKFNLITSGRAWNKINDLLNEDNDFKLLIQNVCIYCQDIKKYDELNNVDIINGVWRGQKPIINFIKRSSSSEIESFPLIKLVTYESYKKEYKLLHRIISSFYGKKEDKNKIYEENKKKLDELINKEDQEKKLKEKKTTLDDAFQNFEKNDDIENIKLIIKEYTKNTFYGDFNRWQLSLDAKYYISFAYFASRLIFCLNEYGKAINEKTNKNNYFDINQKIFRGMVSPLKNILPYKRAEKKVIVFPSFTSTSLKIEVGQGCAKRERSRTSKIKENEFSVIYYITNIYKKGWIPNCIDVQDISEFQDEFEILYQTFSFFYVEKVIIDYKVKNVDIYLKTIGKSCILEEEIRNGRDIEYNKKDNMIIVV